MVVGTRAQARASAPPAAPAPSAAPAAPPARSRDLAWYGDGKRRYKDLTPTQQSVTRHNRFLDRVWKMPRSKRGDHRHCVACLGDFLDFGDGAGHIATMACDHLIHLKCLVQHADAYCDMKGVPRIDNNEAVMAMPDEVFEFAIAERFAYRRLGAPCPACRMPFPMEHMTAFEGGGQLPKTLMDLHVQQNLEHE